MNDDDDKALLQGACQALTNAVDRKYHARQRKWTPAQSKQRYRAAQQALRRAHFVLSQLLTKRRSLQHGVRVLSTTCWKHCRERLEQHDDNPTLLLHHVFSQYLRLRDGLVLLESGECRHPGDEEEAKKHDREEGFASKLSTQSHRNDGYTKLYSSELGYSGYGYDELYDSQVGILRVELPRALSTKWEALVDNGGAQAFESCLDQHETQLKEVQAMLEDFRQRLVRDLHSWVGPTGTVRMLTQDKMERLQVTVPGKNLNLTLERRANDFQVSDLKGVLPNGWTEREWSRAMQLPVAAKDKQKTSTVAKKRNGTTGKDNRGAMGRALAGVTTKKRRVIEDDDSEESTGSSTAVPATGLLVRVETKKKEADSTTSLAAIKLNLGVDADELEAAREDLEAEEAGAHLSSRHQSSSDSSTEIEVLQAKLRNGKINIERMKRILARVIDRNEDEYEIWDARECLRETTMTLGNDHLAMASLVDSGGPFSASTYLEEALHLFVSARNLVKEQEAAHDGMTKRVNDISEESCMIRRNLLLLRGRAHTNVGIASIERSRLKEGCATARRKSLLSSAVEELQNARNCTSAIRSHAVADRCRGSSCLETTLDARRADELESLGGRWLGQAHWYQGHRQEAVRTMEAVRDLFTLDPTDSLDTRVFEIQLLIGVHSYYAAITLADLASEEVEALQGVCRGDPGLSELCRKGQSMVDIARNAYFQAAETALRLQKCCDQPSSHIVFGNIQREHALCSARDIQGAADELGSWWSHSRTVVESAQRAVPSDYSTVDERPRNDLFAAWTAQQNSIPSRRFTIGQAKPRRLNRSFRSDGKNLGRRWAVSSATDGEYGEDDASPSPERYRKWGDDLLPQAQSTCGRNIPEVQYPSCAPERNRDLRV